MISHFHCHTKSITEICENDLLQNIFMIQMTSDSQPQYSQTIKTESAMQRCINSKKNKNKSDDDNNKNIFLWLVIIPNSRQFIIFFIKCYWLYSEYRSVKDCVLKTRPLSNQFLSCGAVSLSQRNLCDKLITCTNLSFQMEPCWSHSMHQRLLWTIKDIVHRVWGCDPQAAGFSLKILHIRKEIWQI